MLANLESRLGAWAVPGGRVVRRQKCQGKTLVSGESGVGNCPAVRLDQAEGCSFGTSGLVGTGSVVELVHNDGSIVPTPKGQ